LPPLSCAGVGRGACLSAQLSDRSRVGSGDSPELSAGEKPVGGQFIPFLRGAMIELDVHSENGEVIGKVAVDEAALGGKVLRRLLHQVVVAYMANLRQGTASAKGKGEVAGSGKKPWKQKHTGRARAGMKRSPLWVGGGIVFPPRPRDYRQGISKSMRRKALSSAILSKLLDGEVTVIEGMKFDAPRTKRVAAMIKALGLKGTALLVGAAEDGMLVKSARNLQGVDVAAARCLNAYEVLRHKNLVVTREVAERLADVTRACEVPA
jgi:large subunit ribosomal protein L4